MDAPKITWYVKENTSFIPKQDYFAGTYTKSNKISTEIQIWNNRYGTVDVLPLEDAVLNLYFDTLEDSALLSGCKVILGGYDQLPLIIKNRKASVNLGVTLQGIKNDGDPAAADNAGCFINLTFEFDAPSYRLKENDLKHLYFEIVSNK